MSGHDDFAFDPLPGLPERPPQGELILWQGRPDPAALARDAYRIRWIAGYLVLLVLWRSGTGLAEGGPRLAIATGIPYAALALVALGLVYGLAWAQARSTTYTITTARVVMRIGAALPVTFNLPFVQIGAASLDLRRDGTGTIAFETLGATKIAVLIAWPHLRPGFWARTQPALRAIPDAAAVARVFADAAEARVSQPQVGPVGLISPIAAE